ncbi:hypothetical protein P8452_08792 [Trifolium repens]|nr:hypothetical protein P8452_08792 [Trifolium repens]
MQRQSPISNPFPQFSPNVFLRRPKQKLRGFIGFAQHPTLTSFLILSNLHPAYSANMWNEALKANQQQQQQKEVEVFNDNKFYNNFADLIIHKTFFTRTNNTKNKRKKWKFPTTTNSTMILVMLSYTRLGNWEK